MLLALPVPCGLIFFDQTTYSYYCFVSLFGFWIIPCMALGITTPTYIPYLWPISPASVLLLIEIPIHWMDSLEHIDHTGSCIH